MEVFSVVYEKLLDEAYEEGLNVKEKPLKGSDGRISGKRIAIRKDIDTTAQKACVLAEELGHYYTTVGDIVDQDNFENMKQEYQARGWAYHKLVPLDEVKNAYAKGYGDLSEMAEFLGVDEQFLAESIDYYKVKYGETWEAEKQKSIIAELLGLRD